MKLIISAQRMDSERTSLHQSRMKRIAKIRKARGLTAVSLANRVEISQPYLSQIEHGKRRPSVELVQAIADVLDVSVSELYDDTRSVPVAGRIGAGTEVELVDAFAKGDGLYHVKCPSDLPARSVVAVEINGDSMLPFMRPGDVLLFRRNFLGVDPDAIDRVAIVETEDGRAMVKLVRPGREGGTFDLYSTNTSNHPPEYGVRLKWAAPYRRHLKAEDIEIVSPDHLERSVP